MPGACDDPDLRGDVAPSDSGTAGLPSAGAYLRGAATAGGEPSTVVRASHETRASRRATSEAAVLAADDDARARDALPIPLLTTTATLAISLLIAVSGPSGQLTTGLALVFAGLVLAWGWPSLLGSPSPRWSGVVVGVGGVSVPATAGLTPDAEQLRWLPVPIGITLILCFLQQLLRRDRTRLTDGLAASIAGLAIATAGAPLAVVPVCRGGSTYLVAAMAAVAVGALVEQLTRVGSVQRWVLVPVLLAGGLTAYVVALLAAGTLTTVPALLIGVLAAAISHALRRVMAVQPTAAAVPSALANGTASVLIVGVVVYLLTRVFIG